jgi:hypothetical protein
MKLKHDVLNFVELETMIEIKLTLQNLKRNETET